MKKGINLECRCGTYIEGTLKEHADKGCVFAKS